MIINVLTEMYSTVTLSCSAVIESIQGFLDEDQEAEEQTCGAIYRPENNNTAWLQWEDHRSLVKYKFCYFISVLQDPEDVYYIPADFPRSVEIKLIF